jgi:hypothetical protein
VEGLGCGAGVQLMRGMESCRFLSKWQLSLMKYRVRPGC